MSKRREGANSLSRSENELDSFTDFEPCEGAVVFEGAEDPAQAKPDNWERSLEALSTIGARKSNNSKRLVWELDWEKYKDSVVVLSLTPLEQSLQKQGWSRGRRVALKRLSRHAASVAGVTEQDMRAISAIRATLGYYGTEYSLDAEQALLALAGHPLLFKKDGGDRVTVVNDEPRLSVRSGRSEWLLLLENCPEGEYIPRIVVREAEQNILRVTHFEERHVRMAHILGRDGLTVPFTAREKLLQVLGSLASFITIHSDLEGVASELSTVKTDSKIHVRLHPTDDGLNVELNVRPLGAGGGALPPGARRCRRLWSPKRQPRPGPPLAGGGAQRAVGPSTCLSRPRGGRLSVS